MGWRLVRGLARHKYEIPQGTTDLKKKEPQSPIPDGTFKDAADAKAAMEKHITARTYKIEFDAPEGVVTSFGPFGSMLNQTTFDRVANPGFDPMDPNSNELMVGTTEDSNYSYGIAVYWSVMVWDRKHVSAGFVWGVAYTIQNQVDDRFSGLLGVSLQFNKTPIYLHIGGAFGQETELTDGWDVGSPIGATQSVPTKPSLGIAPFLGLGFRFGGGSK